MSGKTTHSHLARRSSSLEFGLRVWQCFDSEKPELGISELSTLLKRHKGTVHRYVKTLVVLGLLEQLKSYGKYRLAASVVTPETYQAVMGNLPALSGSVAKGFRILAYIDSAKGEVGIINIADALGIASKSGVHRYAASLLVMGYIEQNQRTRQYRKLGTASSAPETVTITRDNASSSMAVAIKLLDCFKGSDVAALSNTELAAALGLRASTVYRYARTLDTLGILERHQPRGAYYLSAASISPSMYHVFDAGIEHSKSVARGFAVLSCYYDTGAELGGSEVARMVGASSPSTAHRYITGLVATGYLVQNRTTRRYRLNPKPASMWDRYFRKHRLRAPNKAELALAAA